MAAAELGVIGIPGASELPSFVAVEVSADATMERKAVAAEPADVSAKVPAPLRHGRSGVIEIELGTGRCVRLVGDVDAEALRRVLDVLDGR